MDNKTNKDLQNTTQKTMIEHQSPTKYLDELRGSPFFNDNANIYYIEFTLQETFGDINGVIIILKS